MFTALNYNLISTEFVLSSILWIEWKVRGRISCLLPTCLLGQRPLEVPYAEVQLQVLQPAAIWRCSAAQVLKWHLVVQWSWGTVMVLFITTSAKTLKWRKININKDSNKPVRAASPICFVGPGYPPWQDHLYPLLMVTACGSKEAFIHSKSRKRPNPQLLLSKVQCIAVHQTMTPSVVECT